MGMYRGLQRYYNFIVNDLIKDTSFDRETGSYQHLMVEIFTIMIFM